MSDRDRLTRFMFEQEPIRGEIVHLDASWAEVLQRHTYPVPVRDLLGQMMAAAVLLSATLKFDGSLIIQLEGSGPIELMVVECTSGRALRGVARFKSDITEGGFKDLVGDGRMVITIDQNGNGQRYQGIVEITGDTLADALQHYLHYSEQLDTLLVLAANSHRAVGMLLQRLPGDLHDEDAWQRAQQVGATVTIDELDTLDAEQVIYRLFHEETIRLFDSEPVIFRCSCTAQRVETMLLTLGKDEVQSILDEQGLVSIDCEFCNQHYQYDAIDIQQLFADKVQPSVPKTRH